jgi:UDP-N-acetylglucosamine diphosphorylase / glucose-1-phosphate thymidylyltransferase / UDP-N-acetylgalactosamine diphosphorylase / glucosamine-1-phosphate N-acetyltransferase / galactosamine-1-phosphate N-acetyltransferase
MQRPIALLENESQLNLFPFTQTRSVADLRVGIFTIREKWSNILGYPVDVLPAAARPRNETSFVPANILPGNAMPETSAGLDAWVAGQQALARPWELVRMNHKAIIQDFAWICANNSGAAIPSQVRASNPEQIFIEPGARLEHCIINASEGPVYIGKDALVMDGAMLRGPVAVCEGAVVKMGAAIYGATTIGPYSVAGGEIKNSILLGYSNKAHEGYLGDAVLGEWCNLGAGTSCSNLKNSAREVKVWNEYLHVWEPAGTKCGLLMGDFSRAAIHSSFNTGTVTGICCNIFGDGSLTPKFIPSFSWGTGSGVRYELDKALEDIRTWMRFKNREPGPDLENIIRKIYLSH